MQPARLTWRSSPPPSPQRGIGIRSPVLSPHEWASPHAGTGPCTPSWLGWWRRRQGGRGPTRGTGPEQWAATTSSVPRTGRSPGSEDEQCDAISDARDSVECCFPTDELVHAAPETVGPPLLPCPAHGDAPGAVAVEAAVQLGAPVAGVGGGCGWGSPPDGMGRRAHHGRFRCGHRQ